MSKTTTSYGLTADFSRCAWELRDRMHDKGIQVIQLTNLVGADGLCGPGTYFSDRYKSAKMLGRKLSLFLEDVIDASEDDILCVGYWETPARTRVYALFAYEGAEDPGRELLSSLGRVLACTAERTTSALSLEGLSESSEVSSVLGGLYAYFSGDWGKVAQAISSTGAVGIEAQQSGGAVRHVVRPLGEGEPSAVEHVAKPAPAPPSVSSSGMANVGGVMIPGYPPHAFVSESSAAVKRRVTELTSRLRVEDWPRRCEELRSLTGHEGAKEEAWLAIVAKQISESRVVEPGPGIPGYVRLPLLFDRGGRPLFAILRASSDPADVRPSLVAIMDHEGAAANVPIGVAPTFDPTFHVFDHLSYLNNRASRLARSVGRDDLEALAACVAEGRPIAADALEKISEYARTWSEMRSALEGVGRPDALTLDKVGELVDDWFAKASRRLDYREAVREVVEECSERFKAVVPWGHPVIVADLARLDDPDDLSEQGVRELEGVYEALVDEMERDDPYESRGLQLEKVEKHLGPLGAMFDMLRAAFAANPVSLGRLRHANAPRPAAGSDTPVAPELEDEPADDFADFAERVEREAGAAAELSVESQPIVPLAASTSTSDEAPLLDEVPSFRPDEPAQPQELEADELSQIEAFAASAASPSPIAEEEVSSDPEPDAGLRDRFPGEYREGRETGVACNFSLLFELGSRRAWPRLTPCEGTDVFSRCALMGSRDVADVLDCAEEALRDGVRPAHAYRILDPVRGSVPDDPSARDYQRFWLLAALADRLGFAAGEVSSSQLLEDCEYLMLCDAPLSLGPGAAALLAEAFLTAVTHHLSGRTVGMFRSLLDLLDEKDVQRAALQGLSSGLGKLLSELEKNFAYNPTTDYSAMTLPALGATRVREQLDALSREAVRKRDMPPSTNYLPAKIFWTGMASREEPESRLKVGVLLADMASGGTSARVDRRGLRALRDDLDDSLDSDHKNLFWTAQGHGAYERIVGQARQALISSIREVYDLYERYLGLLDEGATKTLPGASASVAAELAGVDRDVLSSLRGLNAERKGGWDALVELVLSLQVDYPFERLSDDDPLPADFSEDALPADLRTEPGRALVETMLHASLRRSDGRLEVPNSGQLVERVENEREALARAFTFNAVDERLYGLLSATLARTLGVADSVGGAPQGRDMTSAVLASWTLDLVGSRVDALGRELISRAARLLGGDAGLDPAARSLLEDAVSSGDLARVFAYADYEVDNAVLSLSDPPRSYEDEFYGGADGSLGLIDPICRGLSVNPRQFGYRNLPFDPDLANPYGEDRADLALSVFNELRRALSSLKACAREHRLPLDGASVATAGEGVSHSTVQALDAFSRHLRTLFSVLGFEDAEVAPFVSHADVAAPVSSWRLRFFARPSETDSRGELVCPLREFVTLVDPQDGVGPARVEYEVEVFTSYDALERAFLREVTDGGVKRLALYLALSEADLLTPQGRRDLMPARRTPRSLRATGMLLLDEVLVAYLASVPRTRRSNDRLSAFFRCALPFTAPHPYGDDVRKSASSGFRGGAGAWQPPLFYGRGTILQQLRTRTGTTFIYGARRMGKTSILRELAAEERAGLHDPQRASGERVCVSYVDAMGFAGIDLDNFWIQFVGRGFVRDVPQFESARSADDVRRVLTEASAEARFYLLIDEADDLLRYDSFLRVGHPRNAIMNSLVEYMQENEKFRVILGGLHATMRYADERARSNQTRGQLGHAVVVGPLWEGGAYEDAVRLVREPLKTMGYVLRDEDVLKILSKSCYFPNLINIVCEQLLVTLRQQRRSSSQGTFVQIPGTTVDAVLREATGALAEKFQLTIELDPGYDVAISSLMSLEADSAAQGTGRRAFTGDELLRQVVDVCVSEDGQGPVTERDLADSGLPDGLGSDVDELVRFGILKKVDGLVMLRDGSMRALVGRQLEPESARMALLAACRRYLDRDVLEGRFDDAEARNVVPVDGVTIYSPVNARDVGAIERALGARGHCVLSIGDIAGADLLVGRFDELLPGLCHGLRPTVIDGSGLGSLLETGLPEGLVVVTDGWGSGDLRVLRERGDSPLVGSGVLLVASPRTVWELRSELTDADDVVSPTAWSDWTCLAWVRSYTEHFERSTAGTIQPRAQRSLAALLKDYCGGQAGAVARVVRGMSGGGSSFSLREEMRSFSQSALDGGDFAWALDGSLPEARAIGLAWEQLAGFADPGAEHPLDACYGVRDWFGLMGPEAGLSESDLSAVLGWMARTGLARRVPSDSGDLFEMRDWFMRALLARVDSGDEGAAS